jgi:6-phosphofructokinase 2
MSGSGLEVNGLQEILTITLNPAVDIATSVERIIDGQKLYCKTPRIDPGGGGVNVARTISRLRGKARALVVVGGASGNRLCKMLADEKVPFDAVWTKGETRESLAVTDESDGAQYRFSLPGETLSAETGEEILGAIKALATKDGLVVLSGGVAPGLGDDFPESIRAALAPVTDRLIVDTSKAPLERLVQHPSAPVYLLRLDRREAEQAAGRSLPDAAASIRFSKNLIAAGVARNIVMGRAEEGSLFVSPDTCLLCRAPKVDVVSKIGAGDAFVGALTLSLSRGEGWDMALQFGVAAASATMKTAGTGLCDLEEVMRLLPECEILRR